MSAPVSNSLIPHPLVPVAEPSNKNTLEIVTTYFKDSKDAAMTKIKWLVSSYLEGEELAMIYDRRLPFANEISYLSPYISLDKPEVLVHFIQNPKELDVALRFVRVMQVSSRSICVSEGGGARNPSGVSFAMEHEAIACLMQFVKDETFLELAAASGELTILAALAGAKTAYMNEFQSLEIERFNKYKKELPESYQEKLIALPGSCFDLEKKGEFKNKIGVLLCRNFIHFLTSEKELTQFFYLVKYLLKPGGIAILTADSSYNIPDYAFRGDPAATAFHVIDNCITVHSNLRHSVSGNEYITDKEYIGTNIRCYPFTENLEEVEEGWFQFGRRPSGNWFQMNLSLIWGKHQREILLVKEAVITLLEKNPAFLENKMVTIQISNAIRRRFADLSLRKLAFLHDFVVQTTFVTNSDSSSDMERGHLVNDPADFAKKGHKSGIIFRAPFFSEK